MNKEADNANSTILIDALCRLCKGRLFVYRCLLTYFGWIPDNERAYLRFVLSIQTLHTGSITKKSKDLRVLHIPLQPTEEEKIQTIGGYRIPIES